MFNPPKAFNIAQQLKYSTLVTSGCSFTYNYSETQVKTWPWVLRDLGGFDCVYDLSCPGAGNTHIQRSIIAHLESNNYDANKTLVVVMWSGYDRDDFLVSKDSIVKNHCDYYNYNNNTALGILGGLGDQHNLLVDLKCVKKIKSQGSRALENYILIAGLAGYLQSRGFDYVFTEFSTPGKMRDNNFDPVIYLPTSLKTKFVNLVRQVSPNLGDWALPTIHQGGDGYHPSSKHQLEWTKQVLLPYLTTHTHTV